MGQSELLRHVVAVLESMHLRYLVTGSTVTIAFGEARFTNDIDIVVDLPLDRVDPFCRAFPEADFYVSSEAARQAVIGHGQFNIIHPASGFKLDIMIPANTPFNHSRFSRAMRVHPRPDYDAAFASLEDVIIKKMEYYREGGSEKHLRDITGVLKIAGNAVDQNYISHWAQQLHLEPIWQAILERLKIG
jgi:hypothetical protein